MEDLESFWTFEKSNVDFEVDELKQKLHYTAYQLQLARKETSEEIRKSNEHMKQLLQLLETTSKERDEAKAQLEEFQQIMAIHKPNHTTITEYDSIKVGSRYNKPNHMAEYEVGSKYNKSNNSTMNEYGSIEVGLKYNKPNHATTITQYGSTEMGSRFNKLNNVVNNHLIPTTVFHESPFSPDSPLLTTNHLPTKTNSSTTITESSSFSLETQTNNNNNINNNNPQSYVSSPVVDSFSSHDSSNIVNFTTPVAQKPATLPTKVDKESLIIANLAKDRPLPPKGNLLKAILEAGPLLSTLMVAGSLPQWRTPPGALTHQIPPVNLKGSVTAGAGPGLGLSPSLGPGVISTNKLNFMHMANMSSGSIGICPSSMLDFGSGSCFMGGRMMVNSGVNFDCQISKRQRII